MKYHYDKKQISSLDDAVELYKHNEFASPTRSTIPLLSWLKHEPKAVLQLLSDFRPLPTDCNIHLEYTVAPPKGIGKPSHTDLMVFSGENSLAVESKWTETRYETVNKWLLKGRQHKNRRDVLEGWLDLLGKHIGRDLKIDDFSDAVYQMVHRAASACSKKRPHMAYLVFGSFHGSDSACQIKKDLLHLRECLGSPEGFPFLLIEITLEETDKYTRLKECPKNKTATVLEVCKALKDEAKIFNFSEPKVSIIGKRN